MKNVKLGFFALLGLVAATSAFTNAPKHLTGTTYYAVTIGSGHYTWQLSPGTGNACQNLSISPACTIVTGGTPPTGAVDEGLPSGATLGPNTGKAFRVQH